ncbi:MAG: hypothetical protein HQ510_02615 [Candidatus Marinimicrobia bacterium]|nr:hypothetical protein [Candidatus Neomarinimicrobiota bacterium]
MAKQNQVSHSISKDSMKLLRFIAYVISVMSFMVLLLVVKNECRRLGKDIDYKRSEVIMLADEIGFLESSVSNLSRPDRIRKIVSENLNMYSTAPESLIVYLGDFK